MRLLVCWWYRWLSEVYNKYTFTIVLLVTILCTTNVQRPVLVLDLVTHHVYHLGDVYPID